MFFCDCYIVSALHAPHGTAQHTFNFSYVLLLLKTKLNGPQHPNSWNKAIDASVSFLENWLHTVCVCSFMKKSRFNFSFFINIISEDSFKCLYEFIAREITRKELRTTVNNINGILLSFLWSLTTSSCNCFVFGSMPALLLISLQFPSSSCRIVRSIAFCESVISKWHEVIARLSCCACTCFVVCKKSCKICKSINLQQSSLLLLLLRTSVLWVWHFYTSNHFIPFINLYVGSLSEN